MQMFVPDGFVAIFGALHWKTRCYAEQDLYNLNASLLNMGPVLFRQRKIMHDYCSLIFYRWFSGLRKAEKVLSIVMMIARAMTYLCATFLPNILSVPYLVFVLVESFVWSAPINPKKLCSA